MYADPDQKGAGALRRKHVWLALLVAGLVLLVMSGCSQAKQAGTRSVSTAADLIAQMADQEVSTSDSPLESGTAAAATHLLKNRSTVVTGEENGLLAQALRDSADAQRYNPRSTPPSAALSGWHGCSSIRGTGARMKWPGPL